MTSGELDAYFARIGNAGERTPTLATLRAVHARHAEAIAFENLSPLLGLPVPLDLTCVGNEFQVQAKIRDEWRTLYQFSLQE